jgi:hypothetical protein
VEFFVVYIKEAHPSDGWQMPSNVKQKVVFATPKTFAERQLVANTCVRDLGVEFPALIDGMDNATELAYTAWPDRIYLVNIAGRIAYQSRPGPFGFNVHEVEQALSRL